MTDHNRLESALQLLVALSAITLFNPFYSWGVEYLVRGAATAVGTGAILLLLYRQRTVEWRMIVAGMAWLLFSAWKLLPFREQIDLGPGVVTVGLLLLFLFLDDADKREVFLKTEKIFAVLGLLSLVVVAVLATGVELPHVRFDPGIREDPAEFFYLYPGTVILSSQGFPLPTGGTLFRSSGIFPEPGHFGVVCGLLLAGNEFRFDTTRAKMLLLGGISTLSGSFFAIFGAGIAINFFRRPWFSWYKARIGAGLLCLIGLVTLLFSFAPEEFRYRVVWKRFEDGFSVASVYESRASHEFNRTFETYRVSPESIIGRGPAETDVPTDWRRAVVRYGWTFIPLFLLLYGTLFVGSKAPSRVRWHMTAAVLIVALHRVAFVDMVLVIALTVSALAARSDALSSGEEAGGSSGDTSEVAYSP